jgi:hypothetical protein
MMLYACLPILTGSLHGRAEDVEEKCTKVQRHQQTAGYTGHDEYSRTHHYQKY